MISDDDDETIYYYYLCLLVVDVMGLVVFIMLLSIIYCVLIYVSSLRLQRPKPHIRLQASVSCLAPSI